MTAGSRWGEGETVAGFRLPMLTLYRGDPFRATEKFGFLSWPFPIDLTIERVGQKSHGMEKIPGANRCPVRRCGRGVALLPSGPLNFACFDPAVTRKIGFHRN